VALRRVFSGNPFQIQVDNANPWPAAPTSFGRGHDAQFGPELGERLFDVRYRRQHFKRMGDDSKQKLRVEVADAYRTEVGFFSMRPSQRGGFYLINR
jgi:hypothetical protein